MARTKKRKAERARVAAEQQHARLIANQPAVTVVCGSSQWMVKADWPPKLKDLTRDGILKVAEDEEVFHEVMRFMQLSEYHAPDEDVLLHMRAWCTAKKYQVKSLVEPTRNKFIEGLKLVWDTPIIADAIIEAYSNDATSPLHKHLWLAINQRIGELRQCRSTYVDFWTAAAAFPKLEEDLESDQAQRAVRLAWRQDNLSTTKAKGAARRARKKAERLASKAAVNSANDGAADGTPVSDQNADHVAEDGWDGIDSERYESSVAEGDDDDSSLSAEDLDGVEMDNVVERRTRGRTVFYTSGGKAINKEHHDQLMAKKPERKKYRKVTTERARDPARTKQ